MVAIASFYKANAPLPQARKPYQPQAQPNIWGTGWDTSQERTQERAQEKSFTDAQDVADFDIDFGNKSVSGKLITKGRQDPVFSITGKIAGNGWTGTASTTKADAGGYKIDSSSTGKSIVIKDANVTGGFYGPNANEMGGSFTHNADDSKASVVFGTKKTTRS